MRSFSANISFGIKKLFSPSRSVVLQGRISLEDDPYQFMEQFREAINRIDKNGGALEIDLREVTFIYPSALVFLLALAETLGPNVRINLIVNNLSQIHEYLIFSGFSEIFKIPDLPSGFSPSLKRAEVLKLESGEEILGTQQKAQWFVDQLSKVKALTQSFEGRAVESVDEILRNVKQHSAYSKWYGIGQVFPTSKRIRMVVYDNGRGIKRHLTLGKYSNKHPMFRKLITQKHYREIRDEPAHIAIEAAATYMVSGTNYIENSGAGLRFLIDDFGREFSGTVSILSGNGIVIWHSGEIIRKTELPFEIKGTMVSITAEGLE